MAVPRTAALSSFIAVGALVFHTASPASAQISRVGVVTTLDGTATLSRTALPQGVPLKVRDDVFVSDRIVTGDKSFARILLGGKAIVTVRERSVLSITEAPGTSVVDVSTGRVAVAVVKERMKPGESVEIRTPNAVAGIRGTVVIAEVDQATSQMGPVTSGGFTTTITVLKGLIEFRRLDGLTRQPSGPPVPVGALQSIRVTGGAPPRPVQKVPTDVQQRLINDFRVPLRGGTAATNSTLAEGQLRQAVTTATVGSGGADAPSLAVIDTSGSGSNAGGSSSNSSTGGSSGASGSSSSSAAASAPAGGSAPGSAPSGGSGASGASSSGGSTASSSTSSGGSSVGKSGSTSSGTGGASVTAPAPAPVPVASTPPSASRSTTPTPVAVAPPPAAAAPKPSVTTSPPQNSQTKSAQNIIQKTIDKAKAKASSKKK
jgi:hypothetical protein